MQPTKKLLDNNQTNFSPSSKNSNLYLPTIQKNQVNKKSSFTFNSRLGSSKISQMSKSNFIGYETKSFQQKISDKIKILSRQDYQYVPTGDIYKEYSILKIQLKHLGEQLNRAISLKNYNRKFNEQPSQKNTFAKSRFLDKSLPPYQFENIYEGFEKNNQKILLNNSTQLGKLISREQFILQKSPQQLKQELRLKILQTRQQLQKQNKNYKKLILQSQKIGNDILNTDKLVEQMRMLENQLNILQLRKKKLEEQFDINNAKRELVQEGKSGIYEKQYELEQFQETQKKKKIFKKSLSELQSQAIKKQRVIAALKKDKQARNKIKAKQYYNLLSQLNRIQERQQQVTSKYQRSIELIQKTKKQCIQMQRKYDSIVKNPQKVRLFSEISNKVEKKNDTRNSFYKSKRNLDTNEIQQKDMLKQIEQHLQKTHKRLQQIQKKSPSQKNSQTINKINSQQQVNYQVSSFELQKQNKPVQSSQLNLNNYMKKQKQKNKKTKNQKIKIYQQFSDSEIPEQQQEDMLDESTKRAAEQIFEDVYLAENFDIDEEIQT